MEQLKLWSPTPKPSPHWITANRVKLLKVGWHPPPKWETPTSVLHWSSGQLQITVSSLSLSSPMCAVHFHQNSNSDPTYFKHWHLNLNQNDGLDQNSTLDQCNHAIWENICLKNIANTKKTRDAQQQNTHTYWTLSISNYCKQPAKRGTCYRN